jgi:hypothetical protein
MKLKDIREWSRAWGTPVGTMDCTRTHRAVHTAAPRNPDSPPVAAGDLRRNPETLFGPRLKVSARFGSLTADCCVLYIEANRVALSK